ncbi:MAG: hypothetical protein IPI67_08335 [Myxococcales bacterium]|nr:hypothetical protein [Myxococcales bacterium]
MSPRTRFAPWLVALCFCIPGCGGSPEDAAANDLCVPNQSVSCTCPSGGMGVQECAADGNGYGACTGCTGSTEGCTTEPDCGGCSSCFDSCACQGGDAKACLKQCAGSSSGGGASGVGGSGAGGGSGSGGYSGGSGSGGYSGGSGSGGSGGYSGGGSGGGAALDCTGCVAQSCGSELSGCTQTSGCIELVQCAQASGCSLSDYGCLLIGCGTYLFNFKALPPAMSLGGCASQACAVECS